MAGNPDQQEDTLDDQYQEEVEDEVRETNMYSLSHTDPNHQDNVHIFSFYS